MIKAWYKIILLNILSIVWVCTVNGQNRLSFNGKEIYANGINMPWHYFGVDVGIHHEWGHLYDPVYFESFFSACQDYGVNTVRFWLHADGRGSPEFDQDGSVTGVDSLFFSDLDDILLRAEQHDVMIILCLWSFDMCKDYSSEAGIFGGNHQDLITDIQKTTSYIEHALVPMVLRYKDACNLLAIEIINEPEWAIQDYVGAGVEHPVPKEDMQRFVAMCCAAIHQHSDIMVTVGSTSIGYNSTHSNAVEHLWSDQALQNAYSHSLAFLDFYQVHYYDWMHWSGWNVFMTTPTDWLLDKPAIIGEFPARQGLSSVDFMVQSAYSSGWAGAIPWSYDGQDGAGTWEGCKHSLKQLAQNHSEATFFSCQHTAVYDASQNTSLTWPNPSNGFLHIPNDLLHSFLSIYDCRGSLVKSMYIEESVISLHDLQEDIYLLQFTSTEGHYIQKLLVY